MALNLTREYTDVGEDKLNISTVDISSQAMIIKSGRKKKLGNEILILVGSFDGTGISELVGVSGKIKQNSRKDHIGLMVTEGNSGRKINLGKTV